MLIGNFHHTLEQKGRLAIPKQFRDALGDNPILTIGFETCLQLLPFNTWSDLTKDLGTHPLEKQHQRELRRLLSHSAASPNFDSQGRISLPTNLIAYANLKKKVVVAGSIDWIEIWDLDAYTQHISTLKQEATNLANKFTNKDDK